MGGLSGLSGRKGAQVMAAALKAFSGQIGQLLLGKLGSNQKAQLIVRLFRLYYGASAIWVLLIWYTAWRNERVAPGEIGWPFPGVKKLKERFPPDRPGTDDDPGYAGPGGGGAAGMKTGQVGKGKLDTSGGGSWGGTKAVADSLVAGLGLSLSDKRSTMSTTTGGVSDHWTGCKECWAYDCSGSVPDMDKAARTIMSRLGANYSGGTLEHTTEKGGYRIQILYRTLLGGNHFTHIHVGVRKVGYVP